MGTVTRMIRCGDCGTPLNNAPPESYAVHPAGNGAVLYRHVVCYNALMILFANNLVIRPFRGLSDTWNEIVHTFEDVPRDEWPEEYKVARDSMAKVRDMQRDWRNGARQRKRLRDDARAS